MPRSSYFSPKMEVRQARIGRGLFAVQPILKNDVVIDFENGSREYMRTKEAVGHEAGGNPYIIQVADDLYMVRLGEPEKGDYINHSCEPNCGVDGLARFVAMRDIAPGEEITFDYAMTESYYFYRLDCLCGTPSCRKVVTGSDWKSKELRNRYRGYFSAYIQKKIERNFLRRCAAEVSERLGRRVGFYSKRIRKIFKLRP